MSEYVKDSDGDVWRWDATVLRLVRHRDEDGYPVYTRLGNDAAAIAKKLRAVPDAPH